MNSQTSSPSVSCQSPSVRKKTIHLMKHPGNILLHPLRKHFHKKYANIYHVAHVIFLFDLLLIGVIFGLFLTIIFAIFFKPDFTEKIFLDAQVAPQTIVSGAPSTLIFRYQNETGEELRNTTLRFGFPDDFILQQVSPDGLIISSSSQITLGTIPIHGTGIIKIRGIMLGDVFGEQVFHTVLTFVHGEKNRFEQKISSYIFSPSSSTLALELNIPESLVASQQIKGTLLYKNTGKIDFPKIIIHPDWPTSFIYTSSSQPLNNGEWVLPALKAGQEQIISFEGNLKDPGSKSVSFIFEPSFIFNDRLYKQTTLSKNIPLISSPLKISHYIEAQTLKPGETFKTTVFYENTGDGVLENINLSISSQSPFFKPLEPIILPELHSKEIGEISLIIPLRASIEAGTWNETNQELLLHTQAIARYEQGKEIQQTVVVNGPTITTPLSTPVVLTSFGRYSSTLGDQIGRGPIPPIVGEETTYWIFWNINSTMHPLKDVQLTGILPAEVRFTGRQTVSQNSAIHYDESTQMITWTSALIEETFSSGSKVVGGAFEVGITPLPSQIGTNPLLLSSVTLTATDEITGTPVVASGASVSTNLPHDPLAAGLGLVE